MNKSPWQINLKKFSFLLVIWTTFAIGCAGSSESGTDDYTTRVERGRLRYGTKVNSVRVRDNPIFRDVKSHFFVNGKEWKPENDKNLADRINWCDTSPNPKVEILRCFGDATENFNTTYIIRMKDDKPEIQKLDEGVGSVWVNDDGRWLLLRKYLFNIETNEKIDVKGMLWADEASGSAPVQYVIAVSPDMKTVVAMPDNSKNKEGAEEFVSVRIIDTESGNVDLRKVSFTKYPWITAYKEPKDGIQSPPEAQRNFVWEKGADGKDKIIVPVLIEAAKKK